MRIESSHERDQMVAFSVGVLEWPLGQRTGDKHVCCQAEGVERIEG